MALGGKGGFCCCAVASGPAFEGAGISCGMLPYLPTDKLHNTGNTALAGASIMALDTEKIGLVRKIAQGCDYIELSGRADFAAAFAESITF